MKQRKIIFNYLFWKVGDIDSCPKEQLCLLLDFLMGEPKVNRKQDINDEKFAFVDSYKIEEKADCDIIQLLFKSARHSYRSPLIDRNTIEERDNPKTMDEGEQMKTHALIKIKNGDAIMFLETGKNTLTCKNIVDYLNNSIYRYNGQFEHEEDKLDGGFRFDLIPRDDFREVLANMDRVICAEVHVDKRIIGSDILNYAEPVEDLQENIVLTMKAERKQSIQQVLYQIVDKFNGAHPDIKRVRITGKMPNGTESIIDTAFIVKKEYIDAQQNEETGEYNTPYMFSQLQLLANDY